MQARAAVMPEPHGRWTIETLEVAEPGMRVRQCQACLGMHRWQNLRTRPTYPPLLHPTARAEFAGAEGIEPIRMHFLHFTGTVDAAGATVQWQRNGANVSGATSAISPRPAAFWATSQP